MNNTSTTSKYAKKKSKKKAGKSNRAEGKSSADFDWLSLTMKGNLHSLKVYELDKYLSYHGLMKKRKKEDKVKTMMHHELRNKDPVRIKSIAKTASIYNDDNDNDDCDVDSNFDSDSEEEALSI